MATYSGQSNYKNLTQNFQVNPEKWLGHGNLQLGHKWSFSCLQHIYFTCFRESFSAMPYTHKNKPCPLLSIFTRISAYMVLYTQLNIETMI